jgi:2-dehydro-3-deoxyphosphogluconate aldolase/(4S)-4-hydroxy-2-oxoglutarate aldolase
MDASKLLSKSRIVPVLVINELAVAVDLAVTLRDAGIDTIEVTLRSPDALAAIELIATKVPDIIVGAGSVRQAKQFAEIARHGAGFAVSPGASDKLIEAAKNTNMPFVPGAATASEMILLMEQGYHLQKFFPAELSGGIAKLKALSAPLPEVRFFPTGGINANLASDYLSLSCVSCIGGSWFVPPTLLADKNFKAIGQLAAEALKHSYE